jgi:hypothetical protein
LSIVSEVVVGLYFPVGEFAKVRVNGMGCWVGRDGRCGEVVFKCEGLHLEHVAEPSEKNVYLQPGDEAGSVSDGLRRLFV